MKRLQALFCALLIVLFFNGCSSQEMLEAKGWQAASGDIGGKADISQDVSDQMPAGELEVHFIDVGQGDATLVKCGEHALLIDAGENDKGILVQQYLENQGVGALDYLIVTHGDADHCGGADVIIDAFEIDTVLMTDRGKDTATHQDVEAALAKKDYAVTAPVVGDVYSLGEASFTIIAPAAEDYSDINDSSVGILLEHGKNRFVFTGDAGSDAEEDMLDTGLELEADVLKVAHHGSRTSSSAAFVEAVDPDWAVISCGEGNDYGHPHAATLNLLRKEQVQVFRTDEQGSVVAVSDGDKISWNMAPDTSWRVGEQKKADRENKYYSREDTQYSREDTQIAYVLNTSSKKFHLPDCSGLPKKNREDSSLDRDSLIRMGYTPCKICNP